MVQGVGGTGNTGSLTNITAYNFYKQEWETYRKNHTESTLSYEDYLQMKGYADYFNQQVENYVETGSTQMSDGKDGNTVNALKKVSSTTSAIYQSEDDDTYYEFDYDNGTYRKIEGREEIAKALGLPSSKNVDTIVFGYDTAAIIDYTFGNLDDGQDSSSAKLSGKYSNVIYTNQEFDIDYILNALLMDPNDPQYVIAKGIFDDLTAHVNQWLPDSDLEELNSIAAEYGTNSAEYKAALKSILLKNLDQAQEWIDDHAHVKNTGMGSLTDIDSSGGTNGTDGTDGTESTTGTVPDYDKSSVLNSAGLLADYTNNTIWKSDKVNRSDKSQEEARNQALAKSSAFAESVLTQVENTLISQLGEQCTDEVKKYISKAKQTALEDSSWQDTKWHSAMLNKNKGFTSTCEVRTLVDKFFSEFNTLCTNKGKTNAEVEADKKAAEEKAAREKSAYQSIYNTDFKSVASEAGSNKDIQVVNPSSAADIQAKAESDILIPIKNKIIAKYSGTISTSDLQTMLDNAAKAALSDCTEWATTSNNYVYSIDTGKLISKFQENVKTIINNKGVLA